jgi:hypothetical protein
LIHVAIEDVADRLASTDRVTHDQDVQAVREDSCRVHVEDA